jgi:hypothetical protein
VLALAAGVGIASAEEAQPAGGRARARQVRAGKKLLEAIGKLDLDAQTAEKVAAIVSAHHQEMDNLRRQVRALMQQARQAEEGSEARTEARKKLRQMRQDNAGKGKQLARKLSEVLNDEQMAKIRQTMGKARRAGRMRRFADDLDLTEAQKKILTDARAAAAEAQNPQEKAKIMREAMQALRQSLTDEQKAQARRGQRRDVAARIAKALDLTDEQKAKAKEAHKAALQAARNAEENKRAVYRETMREKMKGILTDEQLEKLENLRQRRNRRPRNRPGQTDDQP